jgi:peroxiredoxin
VFCSSKVDPTLLSAYTSPSGQSLASLLADRSVLLVFLRHFGCTFCREAVADLAEKRGAIEAQGALLAFVHLGTEEKAKWFFTPYGLVDVPRFSDPDGKLYEAFGLVRAQWRQFLNSENVLRFLLAATHGHFAFFPQGDIQRMPGVFRIEKGEIRKAYRHKLISDRPDYLALATAGG